METCGQQKFFFLDLRYYWEFSKNTKLILEVCWITLFLSGLDQIPILWARTTRTEPGLYKKQMCPLWDQYPSHKDTTLGNSVELFQIFLLTNFKYFPKGCSYLVADNGCCFVWLQSIKECGNVSIIVYFLVVMSRLILKYL